jgi:ketosteroid isomerase-like protein
MKAFLLLLLLLTSATTFAQTKLMDEFPAMMKARNTDAAGWIKEHTTPDMVFIAGHDGSLHNKEWMLGLFKSQKSHKADISNLAIQQVGDLAVATGVSTIEAVQLDGDKTNTYKDAFTYTLRWIDGRWMFTNLHHTKIEYK